MSRGGSSGRLKVACHADVGREAGWGHFRECLTVAAALRQRGVEPAFIIPSREPAAARALQAERYWFVARPRHWWQPGSRASLERLFAHVQDGVLLADLVTTTREYVRVAMQRTAGVAVITEHRDEELGAVNFNISRRPELMPLHRAFQTNEQRLVRNAVGRVLVCFGGSDPKNCTGFVLEMLRQGFERGLLPRDIRVDVICGPLFEHRPAIRAMQASYPASIAVLGPVTPAMLARRARAADLAITTGGGTMYEFCAVGLPSIVVPILDKMAANAEVLARRRAVVLLPRVDRLSADALTSAVRRLLTPAARRRLSSAAREAVDGRGAERIAADLLTRWSLA